MTFCGICDFRKKVSIGSLLIISNTLRIKKIYNKKKTILQIISKQKLSNDLLSIVKAFDFIDKIEILPKIMLNKNYIYFQKIKKNSISARSQNSTVELQKLFKKYRIYFYYIITSLLITNTNLKF